MTEFVYFSRDNIGPAVELLNRLIELNTAEDDGLPLVMVLEPEVGPRQIDPTLSKRQQRKAERAGPPYSADVLADGNDPAVYSVTMTFPKDRSLSDWGGPSVGVSAYGDAHDWLRIEKGMARGSLKVDTAAANVITLIIEALEHCNHGPFGDWRASTYQVG